MLIKCKRRVCDMCCILQMLANTKNYINETVTPAMQTAKDVMQPAVQTATQLKDTCVNKVGEYLAKKDNCGK